MLGDLTIILLLLLLVPLLCRLLRIPAIVGLIAAGMAAGPHGYGLLPATETTDILGKIGMLYIMFLSGIEIDMGDFRRGRRKATLFGLYTFLWPFLLGLAVSLIAGYTWPTALLLGSIYGSHTLMTYPVVSRYGVQKNPAVYITVGGTMLAVTLALLLLGGVGAFAHGQTDVNYWISSGVWLGVFALVVVWAFPHIASWFLKRYSDPGTEFGVVAALVAIAAWLATKAGLEGILGAFVAGVALNRRIPNQSPLMNRLTFIGNTVFIPLFLLEVGMTIDATVFLSGWQTLAIAGMLIGVKLSGKWLAAYTAQRTLGLSATERRLIFGLSSASAAGTLAVASIGYEMGILPVEVFNASVILILCSCIVASFCTEGSAKRLAQQESFSLASKQQDARVLIPISNQATDHSLVDLALFTEPRKQGEMFALRVTSHPDEADEAENMLRHTADYAATADCKLQCVIQVAANTANGIRQVIDERRITRIVTGMNLEEHEDTFGNILTYVTRHVPLSVMIYRERQPLNTIEHLRVAVPRHAELESGFTEWFEQIRNLSTATGAKVTFYACESTTVALKGLCSRPRKQQTASFIDMQDWEDWLMIAKETARNDMLIIVSARRSTVSWNPLFESLAGSLKRFYKENNYVVIFPEQHGTDSENSLLHDVAGQDSEFSIVRSIGQWLLRLLQKLQTAD